MRSVFFEMLYVIQVILIALALASEFILYIFLYSDSFVSTFHFRNKIGSRFHLWYKKGALPTPTEQSDQEISENAIDNNSDDFSDELPFEAEYYRTSTERDEFVRPIASPEDNEIDNGDDGIDLDDPNTQNQTPDCTYHIDIKLFYQSIDQLDIKLDGLTMGSGAKSNMTLKEFVGQAQMQIFNNIKGKNLTNELVNDVINYLRQTFVSVYGFEDYCGVSTNVITYFTKNDTQVDSPEIQEEITDAPANKESSQNEMEEAKTEVPNTEVPTIGDDEIEVLLETTTSSEEDTTEEYESRVLTRPKLSDVVQKTINFYKALNNWNFSQQA